MNINRNESLIKRNARIGQVTMFVALAVLAGGMFVSFQYPEQANWSFVALLLGFILSQVGIYYSNRYSRKPRPDEMIDTALKGLDKKFAIYHYITPAAHLLVGPSGVWVLLPYYQRGIITYNKGRWRQQGGGLMYQYYDGSVEFNSNAPITLSPGLKMRTLSPTASTIPTVS